MVEFQFDFLFQFLRKVKGFSSSHNNHIPPFVKQVIWPPRVVSYFLLRVVYNFLLNQSFLQQERGYPFSKPKNLILVQRIQVQVESNIQNLPGWQVTWRMERGVTWEFNYLDCDFTLFQWFLWWSLIDIHRCSRYLPNLQDWDTHSHFLYISYQTENWTKYLYK